MRWIVWFCLILSVASLADAEPWLVREHEGISLHFVAVDSARADGCLGSL